uniref:MARVEL domain-containing protein n=4 Tax=Clonostachys TaxID=110564 RepID=A0A8H7NE29_BIOOC
MSLLALPAPPPTKHSLQAAEDRRPAASDHAFKMDRTAVVILRFLQGVAALTNLVLSSLVINWYLLRSPMPSPTSLNFLTFAPAFSILSIIYLELAPKRFPQGCHPFMLLAIEATNTIFYFTGFIALAIFLAKLVYCTGSVCAVARATSILAAAEFTSWIASTILLAKKISQKGLKGDREPQSGSDTPMSEV